MHAGLRGALLAALALLSAAGGAARAQEPASLALGLGLFNVSKSPTQVEAGLELRRPLGRYGLDAVAGLAVTDEGSGLIYLGLRRDVALRPGWFLTPGLAVGLYEQGDGKDLGGPIEFRSSLELAYELTARSRLGVAFYHLSNASLEEPNPGSNSAILTYAFRF